MNNIIILKSSDITKCYISYKDIEFVTTISYNKYSEEFFFVINGTKYNVYEYYLDNEDILWARDWLLLKMKEDGIVK